MVIIKQHLYYISHCYQAVNPDLMFAVQFRKNKLLKLKWKGIVILNKLKTNKVSSVLSYIINKEFINR